MKKIISEIGMSLIKLEQKWNDSHSFLIKETEGEQHDYFLQAFDASDTKLLLEASIIKKGNCLALITFSINEAKEASSLPQSPFGGLWSMGKIESESLLGFIEFVTSSLRNLGISKISIIQAPSSYEKCSALFTYLLFKSNFQLEKVLSHQLMKSKKLIKKWVESHYPKLNKKAKENAYNVKMGNIQSFSFLDEIASWKEDRGHMPHKDLDRLILQVSNFPERYFVITIIHEGKSVAHALAVKLTQDVLYYFYSAINPKNQLNLTGKLLIANLIKLAYEQKVSLLDFGSSEVNELINHKLMFFKSNYAEAYENRETWVKVLSHE
ncbi:hypothetical protein ACFOUP_11750 [Belliella kenyensis]|uniref:Acetyltransferase (GNAT) domain-containing protein n=1 Tax=Belliella kenyensis TaxID=1472724 RepID=A0ABV8EL85_9BACT|nr:hypothetical protein [Belliella kenyensis]MCH7400637.1 hypothetical protein [Belliella kenyensis]MDN3602076.1 hypothetical protein [Belliella kenyensis]